MSKYLEKFTKNIQIYRINIFFIYFILSTSNEIKKSGKKKEQNTSVFDSKNDSFFKENIYLRKIHLTKRRKNTFNSFFFNK
jgi:hypothetical protein